jgi:chromosome segregation ATPase
MDEEEKTMQSLIRSTMMAMLQPVAEHVREVQEQVNQLVKGLSDVHANCDENKAHLDQQQRDVVALRACVAKVESQIDRLQSDLMQTHREKERLLEDHESTKADVAKVAGNLRASNGVIKALQAKTDDLDTDVGALQQSSQKAAKQLQEQGEAGAKLKEYTEALNGKHTDLVRNVADASKSHGDLNSGVQKFMHACEQNDNALQTELQRVRDHLDSLETRLGNSQSQVIVASDAVKQIETTFRQLKSSLDLDGEGRHSLQAWRDSASQSLKDLMADMMRIDESLVKLENQTCSDKESTDAQCRDIESKVKSNLIRLDKLTSGQQMHGDQLKHELSVGMLKRGLEALGEQSDLLHADQQNLRIAHSDAINKQELHRVALVKTQSDLHHATRELQSTGKQLYNLKDGLAETNMGMTRLGGRYDSCTKNIMGMTKGLQDISKSVGQGEHGLLSPKGPRRLPDIRPLSVRATRESRESSPQR